MNSKLFYVVCVVLIGLVEFSCENEWNTQDFFRREHSLTKPYGG